ncbi:MAG: response regulator [Burkholderiales bacterium]|nr:response regulator [Burkholderiales bacterium]MBP6249955.1 response regulator [Leptothrix sp. (in: b-proteobacteria)]MBP7520734.1 response regulator [Leptothrix sp. (in: b-proteobacteria)]HQY07569.1 LuxR C-terminal-related transcriptional regulator [Burkholderiaceae bacterium]
MHSQTSSPAGRSCVASSRPGIDGDRPLRDHLPDGTALDRPQVHVVDDYADFRQAFMLNLTSRGLKVQGHPSGEAFLETPVLTRRGVVVLDIDFDPPGSLNGIQIYQEMLRQRSPMPVIFLTGPHGEDVHVAVELMSRRVGKTYFFAKSTDFETRILPKVLDFLDSERSDLLALERDRFTAQWLLDKLTSRERDVLQGVLDGQKTLAIALDLGIAESMVEELRASLMDKLGVKRQPAALGALVMPVLERHQASSVQDFVRRELALRLSLPTPREQEMLDLVLRSARGIDEAAKVAGCSADQVRAVLQSALVRMQAPSIRTVRKWRALQGRADPDDLGECAT